MTKTPVGISGLSVYVPPLRVWLDDWSQWTENQWPKIREVVGRSFRMRGINQSVYTMAANAVMRLIKQYDVDTTKIKFFALGTESSTDNSAGAIIIKGMIDQALISQGKLPISRNCEVPEFKHACLGGVYAMKGALRHLALDGSGYQAIVVCSDIAEYQLGTSGEPTQGAGAVAMLIEENPKLAEVDLKNSGSASDYRCIDFRKPMLRFCNQKINENKQIQDFPIFNGKYSTTCYIDETLQALNDMYLKRKLTPSTYMKSIKTLFLHRPYRRMPETTWATAYLFALSTGNSEERAELASYCYEAKIDPNDLIHEMQSKPRVSDLAQQTIINTEAYPLTMAIFRIFRASRHYRREILDKMALGSDAMLDLGNLYTAALPAWMAAGLEQALNENIELAGQEILTLGYGSGDAAEVIPMRMTDTWREAAKLINFSKSMEFTIDLNKKQYEAIHQGRYLEELKHSPKDEFIIDKIGEDNSREFQNLGIEYYKYIS